MQDREPTGAGREPAVQPDDADADAARARMAAVLRDGGRALSPETQRAFGSVPRHVFVPEVEPSAAYRDEAFVIKCGPDGLPVSSSSQPAMMAIMLDQLGLQPGHRVLEIGTGTGYNAAVMSAIVGPAGEVVSVDIDPELVARARSGLRAAGYDRVSVRCADGGYGYPDRAPFDRIIVTAGAWDIAPAWLGQLTARRPARIAALSSRDPAVGLAGTAGRALGGHLGVPMRLRPNARRVRRPRAGTAPRYRARLVRAGGRRQSG